MYLQKLEINGFKSFAKKEVFDFKPGITGIVGPNGSGKSNVADAIRWVLGEQSIKTLRGKKSEDIIFSGSDKKARLGMAEVSLYFNNEKGNSKIDMSEICITRRLYRSGDSEYLINRQKTRLSDIQMLLAQAGMANTSYSIIGQGMIDSFLLSSPIERKEFFEEASGVKTLQIKRQQSLNKLEKTEENLETTELSLREIEPHLNSLTRQVKKLEKRAEIEKELDKNFIEYYGSLLFEIEKKYSTKNYELKNIADKQGKIKKSIDDTQNEISKLTRENVKENNFAKYNSDYQELLNKKIHLNSEINNLQIKQVQSEVVEKKTRNDIPAEIGEKILDKLNELNKLNKLKENKNPDNLYEILEKQEKILDELDKILKPYKNKEQGTKNKEQENFEAEIEKLKKQIAEIEEQIKKIQEKQKHEQEQEQKERGQIWEMQQKFQIAQDEYNKITNEVNNLRIELARLETRRDDLKQEARQEMKSLEKIENKDFLILDENKKRELITEIGKQKRNLEIIGGIDPEVQKEYEQTSERYNFLSEQVDDLKKSISSLEKLILDLDETVKKQFDETFKLINEKFEKYFKVLFDGGRAKLILLKTEDNTLRQAQGNSFEDELEEESEVQKIKDRLKSTHYAGIEIEATPPGKKLKSIGMLSGGERAMTSIALICAIISANPSPFIVLDEVDAALDEANSIRYAEILEKLSDKSQFVVVTHNRATMEKADLLYGVTMGDDGISELLSLKLDDAGKYTNR